MIYKLETLYYPIYIELARIDNWYKTFNKSQWFIAGEHEMWIDIDN